MNSRKKISNKRRSGANAHRTKGLLEVKVRADLAHRQRNRTILVWTCKTLLAMALVGGAVYGVREVVNRMFLKNPEYNVAAVEITDDGPALSREAILAAAGLHLGQNIFSVSLSKAREALIALPQVERVDLQRALPNKITVDIVERRPVAWLAEAKATDPSTSEKSFLIDSKGVIFKPKRGLPEYLRLPAVYGVPVENYLPGETVGSPEVAAALELVQKNSDANRFRLQSIDLSKGYCLIVTDSRRAKLTFGLDDIGRQLDRLGAVLDYAAAQGKEIRTVNLMVERNIPAILADPSAPETDANVAQEVTIPVASSPSTKASTKVAGGNTPAKTGKKKPSPPPQVVQRAEPVVRRAEPVIRRAEAVN